MRRLGRRDQSTVRTPDPAGHHLRQSDLDGAHVPVLGHRRDAERLAPRAPRCARRRRVRSRARGGLGRGARGSHHGAGHRHLVVRAGCRLGSHRRLRARPRHAHRDPARARGAQGVDASAVVERARHPSRGRRRLAVARAVGRAVSRVRPAGRHDSRPDRGAAVRVRRGRPAGRRRRVRRRRDPRRARIPAARVPVAAVQRPHRRVRRLAREPGPPRRRGGRRRPGRVAGRQAGLRAVLRDGLDRGRPHGR